MDFLRRVAPQARGEFAEAGGDRPELTDGIHASTNTDRHPGMQRLQREKFGGES